MELITHVILRQESGKMSKGVEFTIKSVALIALGIMIVVLMYMSFDTVTSSLIDGFVGNLEFPSMD